MNSPEQMGITNEAQQLRTDFEKLTNNPALQESLLNIAHTSATRMTTENEPNEVSKLSHAKIKKISYFPSIELGLNKHDRDED